MKRTINDMAMEMMQKQNKPPTNLPYSRTTAYSRTSIQQNNTKQTTIQQPINSVQKIQNVKKLTRHGKHDQHIIQKSPEISKEDFIEQQPKKSYHPYQRATFTRTNLQNKVQDKDTSIKINPSNKIQLKPKIETQIQKKPSQTSIVPPSSMLYPNKVSQYKIKSKQKIETKKKVQEQKQEVSQITPRQVQHSRPYARTHQKTSEEKIQSNLNLKQEAKKPKIKSNILIFCLARIQKSSQMQSWCAIKQYSQYCFTKFNTFGKILIQSTNSTSLQYLNGLKKHFFKQLKTIMLKQFKSVQKNIEQSLQRNDLKQQNLICLLIQALFKQKIRSVFKKLNNNRGKLDLIVRGTICLGTISKKKQAIYKIQFLNNLKIYAKDRVKKISMMVLNIQNYYNQRKKLAFYKLIKHNLPKPIKKGSMKKIPSVNKIMINKQEVSTSLNKQQDISKQQIQKLNEAITEKKNSFFEQKKSYENTIKEFTNVIKQYENEVSSMAMRNQELKYKLQAVRESEYQIVNSKQQINSEENQMLNKLTQIYIQILKLTDKCQLKTRDIIAQHKLSTTRIKLDPSIENWQLILEHTNLKNAIENIQGIEIKEKKAVLVLEEESQVIIKLIRSYVKQRYLWEWVRSCLHA